MTIRCARPDDVDAIIQFIKDLAEYEQAPDEAVATHQQIHDSFFGADPKVFCHIAEVDGQRAGIAIWFLNYSTWLGQHGIYLEDLYIDPAFRGSGLGIALLKELATICVDRGYQRLQWWVLDWNEPSIEFYKSLGAVAMDEWTIFRLTGDPLKNLGTK